MEYELHGNGEALVLCQPTWWPLDPWRLSGLPELGGSYHVLLFNQRGIGASQATDTDYSIGSMAEDTLALMDALQIARAHFVAFANGSMVTLRVAQIAPTRVFSLVLGAPGHPVSKAPRVVSESQRLHVLDHGYETYIRGHAMNDDFAFSPGSFRAHPERAAALSDGLWEHAGTPHEYSSTHSRAPPSITWQRSSGWSSRR